VKGTISNPVAFHGIVSVFPDPEQVSQGHKGYDNCVDTDQLLDSFQSEELNATASLSVLSSPLEHFFLKIGN
jgi:hypothetical protein